MDMQKMDKNIIDKHVHGFFSRLVDFLKEWSVIGVAIGFVVGSAALDFVNAVVKGLIIPFFQLFFPVGTLDSWNFTVGAVRFDVGGVWSSFLTLIIVIAFLYYFVKRVMKKYGQERQ